MSTLIVALSVYCCCCCWFSLALKLQTVVLHSSRCCFSKRPVWLDAASLLAVATAAFFPPKFHTQVKWNGTANKLFVRRRAPQENDSALQYTLVLAGLLVCLDTNKNWNFIPTHLAATCKNLHSDVSFLFFADIKMYKMNLAEDD